MNTYLPNELKPSLIITYNMNDQPETKTKPWKHIQSELKSAMDTWEELTRKYEGAPSPEDKKLQEMRDLLEELRSKIDDLSKP